MMDLENALRILATSPVAKDREAIARLEKVSHQDISSILNSLEDLSLLAIKIQDTESIEIVRNRKKGSIISAGLVFSGLSCLIVTCFKPDIAIAVVPVAFITGAAAQNLILINQEKPSSCR